jgi:hypothetical protein
MQENDTHSRFKQIIIVVACLLGAVAVGWGAIFILKTLEPTRTSTTPTEVLGAADIISQYSADNAVKGLSTDMYNKQVDNNNEATVIYKASGATYTIDAPAKHSALFAVKDAATPNDTSSIQQQTTAFIEQRHYKKVDNTGSAVSSNPSFITYANDRAVCQLSSAPSDAGLPGYHKLSCANKSEIQAEYTATDTLLALYNSKNPSPIFTESLRTTQTEGNKSLAILSLTGNDKKPEKLLLFAAIDGHWSYIGDLNDSQAESNGKYAISAEVRQAINDPKWGDFLAKNIQ